MTCSVKQIVTPLLQYRHAQTAWSPEAISPQGWLPGYVTSRYGPNTTQGILDAWETMRVNLYSTDQQWQVGAWPTSTYLVCMWRLCFKHGSPKPPPLRTWLHPVFGRWLTSPHFWFIACRRYQGSVYSYRPSASMGSSSSWTDVTAMIEVWRGFHDAAPGLAASAPFLFDYVDVTRQVGTHA